MLKKNKSCVGMLISNMFLISGKKVRHRLTKAHLSHAHIKANTSRIVHSKLSRIKKKKKETVHKH